MEKPEQTIGKLYVNNKKVPLLTLKCATFIYQKWHFFKRQNRLCKKKVCFFSRLSELFSSPDVLFSKFILKQMMF